MKEDFRDAVAEACADQPDLDQTAEFFRSELPDDLRMAGSAVAQRLDAPRNKVAGLTGVPPLRRFFNHPTDIALRDIIEARDVLIVDANMGAIGEDNGKACMHFLLRMLHTQMQRQVHLPETDRPRVPLLVDEAHYVAGAENVVDQIATHRRAGLETTFGLQYFAQLGSGSQHEEKIRKGILNLLQSRFLFRMGDAQDAEEATRIAMAVYSTMIRDDPDSRARLRVTPEQALNFPNHHCLASWIAMGSRIPSFMGQTYAFPPHSDAWAEHHLADLAARVAPYPEDLESTLDRSAPRRGRGPRRSRRAGKRKRHAAASGRARARAGARRRPARGPAAPDAAERSPNGRNAPAPATSPSPSADDAPVRAIGPRRLGLGQARGTGRLRGAARRAELADSPVRRLVGRQAPERPLRRDDAAAARQPARARVPRPCERDRAPQQLDGAAKLPRLFDEDYAILALLDRAGPGAPVADRPRRPARTRSQRRHQPTHQALPPRPDRPAHASASVSTREPTADRHCCTRSPAAGWRSPRQRSPAPAISPAARVAARSSNAAPPGCHTTCTPSAGRSSCTASSATLATDRWRTPRYATGRYPVPQVGTGQRRHPITLNEIAVPDGQAIIDLELKTFREVKPDVSLELRIAR